VAALRGNASTGEYFGRQFLRASRYEANLRRCVRPKRDEDLVWARLSMCPQQIGGIAVRAEMWKTSLYA
jgi:hypothetical protein